MDNHLSSSQKEKQDSGFGSDISTQGYRFINKDGSTNTIKKGLPFIKRFNVFHELISMSWPKFIAVIVAGYFLMNLVFACIYFLIGLENLGGLIYNDPLSRFTEAFFFSTQTFTAVGYGRINPEGMYVNLVASIEALVGLLCFALATGLFYGKFSRADSYFIFSEKAVIAPYRSNTGLMIRLANAMDSDMTEVQVRVVLSWIEEKNRSEARKFYTLELELEKINLLATTWTVVHPINENSPFYGVTKKQLADSDLEVMLHVNGFDSTFSQTVNSRTSYKYDEIVWDAKFVNLAEKDEQNRTVADLSKLGDYSIIK